MICPDLRAFALRRLLALVILLATLGGKEASGTALVFEETSELLQWPPSTWRRRKRQRSRQHEDVAEDSESPSTSRRPKRHRSRQHEDVAEDSESLFKPSHYTSWVEPRHPGRCLSFIHNPRTAGTSIDSLNLNSPRQNRAYKSFMERAIDTAIRTNPLFEGWHPGEFFDYSHGANITDPEVDARKFYVDNFYAEIGYRMVEFDPPRKVSSTTQKCPDLHTPPGYLGKLRKYLFQNDCETFCVVREPMARLLSTYKFHGWGGCSGSAFSEWVMEEFPVKKWGACLGYPQLEYSLSNETQWCNHVLHFENLTVEYNELMKAFGKEPRMTTHLFNTLAKTEEGKTITNDEEAKQVGSGEKYEASERDKKDKKDKKAKKDKKDIAMAKEGGTKASKMSQAELAAQLRQNHITRSSSFCHIDARDINRNAKNKIYEYYRADYEAFGYPRPE